MNLVVVEWTKGAVVVEITSQHFIGEVFGSLLCSDDKNNAASISAVAALLATTGRGAEEVEATAAVVVEAVAVEDFVRQHAIGHQ